MQSYVASSSANESTFHVSGHLTPLMKDVCCKYIRTCWVSPFSARIHTEFLPRFFRAESCGKSECVCVDIRVRLHGKIKEFVRKM